MPRQLLLILPALAGGLAMAWSIYRSYFLFEFNAGSLLWAVVLLGPYVVVAVVAWRSRRGLIAAVLAVFPALLQAGPPFTCFAIEFGEGCLYLLVLSPLDLWLVVAATALLELGSRRSVASEAG